MAKYKPTPLKTGVIKKAKPFTPQDERQQLIFGADALLPNKFSDENLDHAIEKIKLIGGGEISIAELISHNLIDYHPKFPKAFYLEIARLNHWDENIVSQYYKPSVVATWTNQLIYARFPKDVLPRLQELNPFVTFGVRQHKHFQRLSKYGEDLLLVYIDDAIRFMKAATTWYEFRISYGREYGLPVQTKMFE